MRRGIAALLLAAGLVAWHPSAQGQDSPPPPAPPVEPALDRARFEPLGPDAQPLTAGDVGAYRGAIETVPSGGGLVVVNDVGIEDYVKGIVEVPAAWPAEALKAQAIAARTFALNRRESPSPAPWGPYAHICATDSCQVYWGLRGEQRAGGENWSAAVNATAGQVLLAGGRPIFSQYSASNGGRSSAGSQPYLRAVDDPDDRASPLSHWRYAIPLGSLAPLLGVQAPDTLTGVSRQGDAVVFTVQGAAPPAPTTTTTAPGLLPAPPAPPPAEPPPPAARQLSIPVGDFVSRANGSLPAPAGLPHALPTSRFTLTTDGGSAIVEGGGWGHGIGMSQYGALGKANRGLGAGDILAAYYSGIRPTRMDQIPETIRVAVAPESGALTVSSPGLFQIVDGQGNVVVPVATGGWRATPAGGRVRLTPPEDQRGPIVVDGLAVDPAEPDPGAAPSLTFGLSAPALVSLRVVPPGAPAEDLPPAIAGPGAVSVPIPPGPTDGHYYVFVTATAGPGRQGGAPVSFVVGDPVNAVASPVATSTYVPPSEGGAGAVLVAVAVLLLVLDLALALVTRRRRQRAAPATSG